MYEQSSHSFAQVVGEARIAAREKWSLRVGVGAGEEVPLPTYPPHPCTSPLIPV